MPLPPIPLQSYRDWATKKWTDATQAVIDATPLDNWALDAGTLIQDTFTQARQTLAPPAAQEPPPPPPPPPEPEPVMAPPLEVQGPPSPNFGQRAQMTAQRALGGLTQGVGDWASSAQEQIAGLGSGFGSGLTGTPDRLTAPPPQDEAQAFLQQSTLAPGVDVAQPTGVDAGAPLGPPPGLPGGRDVLGGLAGAARYLPGNIGPAAVQDVLSGTPSRLRDDLLGRSEAFEATPAGRWTAEREAEGAAADTAEDDVWLRGYDQARTNRGEAPLTPDEREALRRRLRWLRETGQNLAGGGPGGAAADELLTQGPRLASAGRRAGQAAEVLSSAPLASPTSLLANATSGLVRTLERVAYRVGEGRPLEAVQDVGAMARELGNPELWRRAARSFETGPTPRNPGVTGVQAEGSLSNAPGAVAKTLTAGVRANAATDELVRSINEAGARAAGARRGLTGEALEAFVREAGDFATVTGPNSPVASALNKAKGWIDDPEATAAQKASGWVASAFAPYVGMPERLLVSTLSSTTAPVRAPAAAIVRALRGQPVDARAVAGQVAVGGLLDLWLLQAAAHGGIYGPPPSDRAERLRRERDGAVWDSVVVGEGPGARAVPLRYFGTVGQQASLIADVYREQDEAALKGKPVPARALAGVNQLLEWTLDESYLSDASRFFSEVAAGRGVEAATRTGAGVLGRATGPLQGPVNAADPFERETSGLLGGLSRAVPGGRYALPVRIEPATGEPVRRRGTGLGRYLGVTPGTERSDLADELAERGVGVREFRDGKYTGVQQTPQQVEALRRTYGSEVGREVRAVIASREYQDAGPLDKKTLLQQGLNRAYAEADARLGDTVKRSPKAQAEFEYRAVPQYDGVKGTAEEVRRQNAKIADAKRQVAAARAKYPGNPDKGERELIQRSRETVRLAERARLPAAELRAKRTAIYTKHGLDDQGREEPDEDQAP